MKTFLANRIVASAFLAASAVLCGCNEAATSSPTPKVEPPVEIKTTHAFRGTITRYITLPGEVKPYQQATLYAKVAGYLKTITVDKGDRVAGGQLLAEIEVPELMAEQAKCKAELQLAEADFRRLSESQSKAPDLVVPHAVDEARSKLGVAKADLERTETLLKYTKIIAPFGGIVTRRMVDPGAFIPAATSGGAVQNAALLTLTDFNRVRVQVAVPEAEASLVAVDQPARITVEGMPSRIFQGRVTRFAYSLEDSSKTMLTEIELANEKLELRPGMYATVKIGLDTKQNALLVPVDCLAVERSGASLFILAADKSKKLKVQTGFNDGTNVEISAGLDGEQEVIVLGKRPLSDGQAVTVSNSGAK